jgi:hypothetical protein
VRTGARQYPRPQRALIRNWAASVAAGPEIAGFRSVAFLNVTNAIFKMA